MCKFSIVVPVYQAEKYLEECIYSVVNQKEKSWELILVDDGSTDESVQICDQFAERDSRIRTIHQTNTGPVSARCRGFEMAEGTYLLSLDADDRLTENALDRLNTLLSQRKTEILIFGYRRIDARGKGVKKEFCLNSKIYSKTQKTELFVDLWEKNAFNLVWNKVFQTKFVHQKLQISEPLKKVKSGEDAVIVTSLLIKAETIETVEDVLYEYRIVAESISRKFDSKKGGDIIQYRTYMLEQIKEAGLLNDRIKRAFFQVTYRTISYVLWQCARSNNSRKEKKRFFQSMTGQSLYQESLPYVGTVKFSLRKRISLWFYRHEMFDLFICYETLQKIIKYAEMKSRFLKYRRKNG